MKIRLFWKILISFWLVFALVFSFNLFFTQINSESSKFRSLPPHLHEQLADIHHKLEFILEKNHRSKRKTRRFLRNAYLLDDGGSDYFGKQPSKLLLALHQQVRDEGKLMTVYKKRFLYFGGRKIIENGGTYRLYVSQRFSFLSRGYLGFFIKEFAQNLIISTFFISIPLSFLMAWLFTRPIRKLQLAISELSSDLSSSASLQKLTSRSDEFGELAKDFEKMAQHLDSLIRSKNRLIRDVSHELRTPLARLQLAIGLARQMPGLELSSELDRVKLEADRMNQMISSILDFSRADKLAMKPEKMDFCLSDLLQSIVQDIQFEAQARNIEVLANIDNDLWVKGEQSLILSCVENIMRNALRYANSKISLISKRLPLQTSEQDAHHSLIEIVIRDDGDGVAENDLNKLFEAFYRPQTDRSRDSGGVGLGLSIAKKAITIHHGSITARNVSTTNGESCGFEVEIRLPLQI
jgi:two-component system, OmpR family, sensor histidine kinase CpxA